MASMFTYSHTQGRYVWAKAAITITTTWIVHSWCPLLIIHANEWTKSCHLTPPRLTSSMLSEMVGKLVFYSNHLYYEPRYVVKCFHGKYFLYCGYYNMRGQTCTYILCKQYYGNGSFFLNYLHFFTQLTMSIATKLVTYNI